MRLFTLLLLVVLNGVALHGQKTQILHQSGFKHDYVISPLRYIEDLKDTTRLTYVATLMVSGKQDYYLSVAGWLDLIKIKAKELGANSYFVSSYSENQSTVDLTLRLFFAGEKFLKVNALKKDSNAVLFFNQSHFSNDTGIVYIDKTKIYFDAKTFFKRTVPKNKVIYIATNLNDVTSVKVLSKKTKPSRFFVMQASKKNFNAGGDVHAPGNPEFAFRTGFALNGVPVTFRRNAPYELDYDLGRLLLAVYH